MSCRPSRGAPDRGLSGHGFDVENKQQQGSLHSEKQDLHRRLSFSSQPHSLFQTKSLQALAVVAFLVTWVANGELLQGISNGSFGHTAHNKPVFLTWFSYNFMILSLIPVYLYLQKGRKWTLRHYFCHVWAGKMGVNWAVLSCAIIGVVLQVLNWLLIVGLECISVSLSNATYQLQTVFTLALSVCWLKDPFVAAEAWGVLVSVLGVALVVVPPLVLPGEKSGAQEKTSSTDLHTMSSCPFTRAPTCMGIVATLLSAAIGGAYLVSWRVLDQRRHHSTSPSRLEGLIDTQMTVASIGLCNLLVGWPLWMIMEGTETSSTADSPAPWWLLVLNGIVEYLFDASCAIAIYMTSPVVVAIVSPLTIPLSLFVDSILWTDESTTSGAGGFLTWLGVAVICFGVCLLETKPTNPFQWFCCCWNHDNKVRPTDELDVENGMTTALLGRAVQ